MSENVIVTDDGPIRILRLNRLAKQNALTNAMYETLAQALENAAVSKEIRCVVVIGGPTVFTVGNDLQDFLYAAREMEGLRPQVTRFLHRLAHASKPLVAAVRGAAIGIGTTMLLHCDYVVAAMDARFSTSFTNLGLGPEAGSSLLMPCLMGTRRAFELLVMGGSLDAHEAKELGLVNLVVPAGEVETEAFKAARLISSRPPEGIAAVRKLIRSPPAEVVRRIDKETEIFKIRLQSDEVKATFEGFVARNG
jgi:enoyl-CoA hydratase/carnithine racemase